MIGEFIKIGLTEGGSGLVVRAGGEGLLPSIWK